MEEQKVNEKLFFSGFANLILIEAEFFIDKEFLEIKGFSECYNIAIPVLIEKKYALPKEKGSVLHRGKFLVLDQGQKIMEIKCVSNNRTVFYGNNLIEDKNFYIMQEIDPVFLAIYYLDHARGKKTSEIEGKFLKLEEIICHQSEKENKFFTLLSNNQRFLRGLDLICDKKEMDFEEVLIYYRLNDEKLFKWLDAKTKNIENAIKLHLPHRMETADYNEKLPVYDFLYENLPFSVFDNYLVKHLNMTQNEFGKYKQSLNLAAQKNVSNQENEKVEEGSNKKPKKKETTKKPPQPVKEAKNPITKYFGKK